MESFPTPTPTPPEALNCGDISLMASCLDCSFCGMGRGHHRSHLCLFFSTVKSAVIDTTAGEASLPLYI